MQTSHFLSVRTWSMLHLGGTAGDLTKSPRKFRGSLILSRPLRKQLILALAHETRVGVSDPLPCKVASSLGREPTVFAFSVRSVQVRICKTTSLPSFTMTLTAGAWKTIVLFKGFHCFGRQGKWNHWNHVSLILLKVFRGVGAS